MQYLPPETLRELLDYDPSTGLLTWRARISEGLPRWNERYAGKPAGTVTPSGYVALKIGDRNFLAHRVIWAMVYGAWPPVVTHKNRRRADNRLKNLRGVSRAIAQRHQRMHSTNTSGVTGVSWNSRTQKWVAQIRIGASSVYLGSFDEKEGSHPAGPALSMS